MIEPWNHLHGIRTNGSGQETDHNQENKRSRDQGEERKMDDIFAFSVTLHPDTGGTCNRLDLIGFNSSLTQQNPTADGNKGGTRGSISPRVSAASPSDSDRITARY